ncbi:PepSY-associated TM helix domain-containing protein [Tenacibaculum piscium]|uniref:PepSY-associated TM helix domain-containing protein n=1 Tax=Tenacibaculum piscium TaxID=1458515 RepID=UPI001F2266EA|nr:PepSY-associated TM helix domain-containing protein [Tenacibaculum piscium]
MSKRNYSVFFNTHTVSGIIISIGLYIIFFAGSFSFFKDEIKLWEQGKEIKHHTVLATNYNAVLEQLNTTENLQGRDVSITLTQDNDKVRVRLGATKDTITNPKGTTSKFYYLNLNDFSTKNYQQNYSLSEFLYRLHFLDQIPRPIGLYLSGFIAFFFVFAIVTGIIVHWNKIISNFYTFNPKIILNRLWADAHTALGVIGLPFQFMYGITGAFFMIKIFILIPATLLYGGDKDKMITAILPETKSYKWQSASTANPIKINTILKQTTKLWEDTQITRFSVSNYGGTNMKYSIEGSLDSKKRFAGTGRVIYNSYTGAIISHKNPNKLNYIEDVLNIQYRLHFADYGGISTKIFYFIFGLLTCFVIITGVLVYVEARNKKSKTLKQRLYTAKVGHIYLAICLSMFPVTALAFLFSRITYGTFENPKNAIYWFYFISWLVFTLYFRFKRDNYFTNKACLLLGAIFGFLVPIVNGITSNNWFWKMYANHQYEIFTVDIFWIVLSSFALLFYLKIKPSIKEQSSFYKNPIDYKNLEVEKKEDSIKITTLSKNKKNNYIPMKTKIISLWILIIFGYIFHHIYGLATVFFNQTVFIDGSTGETPMWAHQWRILMEGTAFLFALLTLQLSKKWFKITSLIWAIIVALFNCYHVIEEVIGHPNELSKIWILLLTAIASILLVVNLNQWRKTAFIKKQS